jgi:hypothetical protein
MDVTTSVVGVLKLNLLVLADGSMSVEASFGVIGNQVSCSIPMESLKECVNRMEGKRMARLTLAIEEC